MIQKPRVDPVEDSEAAYTGKYAEVVNNAPWMK